MSRRAPMKGNEMTIPTATSEGEVVVRGAMTRTLQGGAVDFDSEAPTIELVRLAERGQATRKGQPLDGVQALMLDTLRYADSVGLQGNAHVYDEYRYVTARCWPDGVHGELKKTCTINFYFWTEETKGGAP